MLFCIILMIYLDSAFNGKQAVSFYIKVSKNIFIKKEV